MEPREKHDLLQFVTIPVKALPEHVRLVERIRTAPLIPVTQNPAVLDDPMQIKIVAAFFGMLEKPDLEPVRAGVVAIYQENDPAKEIGVYGLSFSDELAANSRFKKLTMDKEDSRFFLKGKLLLYVWKDDGVSDAAFKAIQDHFKAAKFKPVSHSEAAPLDAARDALAMTSFAPLWMPVPRFPRDPESTVPSAAYAMIWQPEWQVEIGLSDEQKNALAAINAKAVADAQRHAEQFKSLSPAEQQARVKASRERPAKLRDYGIRKQIEAVLTPRQLQTLRDFSFPEQAVGLLYDAEVRRDVGFSVEQEDRLRRLARERLARFQQESLKRAERVWGLLSPQQQADLPAIVKRQGPTSAILSIGWELGFNFDNFIASYPMLAESPARERLRLSAEQAKQLQAVMGDAGARLKTARQGGAPQPDAEDDDKKRVEAILTPQQLATLNEIDFHRQVVLALGYPEKRQSIGMTDQQKVDLQRLDKETHEQLYRIDREMLGKALEILTPSQREQLSAEIDRRIGD